MASPTASLCHLRMQVRLAASPLPSYSSIPSHLSPSTCHNGAFVCISLSSGTHRGASLFSRHYRLHTEKKLKSRRSVVVASLFGVGAPEALVIGVVALLVFGPKGLAEVARNLGKTLRTFQPTIRELQDVSREFKSTLEREIGLDDMNPSSSTNYNSAPSAKTNQPPVPDPNGKSAYSSDDLLKVTAEQLSANTPVEESQVATPSVSAESADTTIENQSSEATQVEATPIPTESKPSEKTIEQR